MPVFIAQMFNEEVDSLDHPNVIEYMEILKQGCEIYGGELSSFAVDHGIVAFGRTSDEMAKDIREDWAKMGLNVQTIPDEDTFGRK